MKRRRGEHGYSYVLFLWILAAAVLAISAFVFYRVYTGSSFSGRVSSRCDTKSDMELCLRGLPARIAPTATAELSVTLTNNGDGSQTWSGSSSCAGKPGLVINGKPALAACTTDFGQFSLAPGASDQATVELSGSDPKSGPNTVQVEWAGVTTSALTISR